MHLSVDATSLSAGAGDIIAIVDVQRKVTCFVTRGAGATAQLLVFWHAGSGIQVPAGTVEDGETFDEGAWREVHEETNLPGLDLSARLGSRAMDLPEGRAVLKRKVFLQTRPSADGPATSWSLTHVAVEVAAREDGYARVVYQESDIDSPDGLVYARFEGWVPEDALVFRQERHFFLFRASPDAPDKWRTTEGRYDFHLYWVPLVPKPSVLIAPQQEWLDEFYDAVLEGVRE